MAQRIHAHSWRKFRPDISFKCALAHQPIAGTPALAGSLRSPSLAAEPQADRQILQMGELTLKIRRATDDDRQAIHMVHVRAIREVCSRSYSASQIASWAGLLSPDSYGAVVRERFLVVAEGADGIAGFGQLDEKSGEVEAVYVLPGLQGKGIGGALLHSLEDAARAARLGKLHLSATLNAVSFYERSGYVGEGPIVHRLATGVELQCLRMSKELEPS